jgi:hypothetical protein
MIRSSVFAIALLFSAAMLSTAASAAGCADGVCGLEPPQSQSGQSQPGQTQAQGQPAMPGMQMQGGMAGMMANCPMMKQMAALNDRVRMMEDMMQMMMPPAKQ